MLCNLVPVSSNITKYKVRPPPPHTHTPPHTSRTRADLCTNCAQGVDVMAVPGRLRAEGRDRKIMWRGSQGAASAERHVILPDLQNEPIVFHKKLGEGNFGDVWQGKLRGTTTVAIKTIRSEDKSAFLLEAHIMAYPFPPAPPAATHPPTRHASHTGAKCRQLPAHPNVVTFFGLSSCDVRTPLFAPGWHREVVHARMFNCFPFAAFFLSFQQEKNELFLVTEFVADGSLDRFLTENMYVPCAHPQNQFCVITRITRIIKNN